MDSEYNKLLQTITCDTFNDKFGIFYRYLTDLIDQQVLNKTNCVMDTFISDFNTC